MSARRNLLLSLAGILLLAVCSVVLAIPNGPNIHIGKFVYPVKLRLGLDLLGGTQLLYEANMDNVPADQQADSLQGARDVIERRVNAFGVSEPVVQTTGGVAAHRILVELAGIQNADDAIKLIGETPQLDFREQAPLSEEALKNLPKDTNVADLVAWKQTELTGKNLQRSNVSFDPQSGAPNIELVFDSEGAKKFEDITKRNIGKQLAIFLDGVPITAPVVQDTITEGKAVITGTFSLAEAKQLSTRLNAGALPVPISLVGRTSIGPSLGKDSLGQSMVAGLLGICVITLFMVFLYRIPGVIAALALFLYALVNLVVYKLLGVTMTLAGTAGFILSIGMAVDANILIFERLKDQLRLEHPLGSAITDAFRDAWNSIRDSNVSSLITCVLLYTLGSSIVKGFALTLAIGIVLSMFSAITVTRNLLRGSVLLPFLQKPSLYVDRLPKKESVS